MLYSTDRTADYVGPKPNAEADGPAYGANVIIHPACQRWVTQSVNKEISKSFSDALWRNACKRHSEPRAHIRELLNKFVHPHPVF